jgi:hypothetical protein
MLMLTECPALTGRVMIKLKRRVDGWEYMCKRAKDSGPEKKESESQKMQEEQPKGRNKKKEEMEERARSVDRDEEGRGLRKGRLQCERF